MSRPLVSAILLAWSGTTLVLGESPRFRSVGLVDRLAHHLPGARGHSRPTRGTLSISSFHEVVAPLVGGAGDRLTRLIGVSEELAVKLERVHATETIADYRMRELGVALVSMAGAGVVTVALRPPAPIAVLFLVGAPTLAFLVLEREVARASQAWQRQLFAELPIVTEQLGMLLGSGYSLGAALNRLAARGSGSCAADLRRVCGRIRQGPSWPMCGPSTGSSASSRSTAKPATSGGSSPRRHDPSDATRTARSSRPSSAEPSRCGSPSPSRPSSPACSSWSCRSCRPCACSRRPDAKRAPTRPTHPNHDPEAEP
jgi:hypothetical protein